jgi:two-component system sensor histidine kinase YcbA
LEVILIREKLFAYLFMIIAVPIAGELKFFPFNGADLRVSMATTVFFFILLWSRKIHPVVAGLLTGLSVVLFRMLLDKLFSDPFVFRDSFYDNFPVFFYYFLFAAFFHIFKLKRLYSRPFLVGWLGVAIETISNSAEISIRHFTNEVQITPSNFIIIGGVAIIRTFFVLGFFNILILRETRLAEEQQRKRTEEILLLISNLYVEKVQLEKSAKNAEELTSACYMLYRELKNQNHQEQAQAMLKIAGELHEIKKDNQRIYAGLSKLMAKENLEDFMNIEEIIRVITLSNQNYAEILGKTIHFMVDISGEHPRYSTFVLLSLINNLVANAVEAIQQAGHILLKIDRVDDMIKIRINDSGCGISPKNQSFIFEPGFTTKYDHNGIASNGIGLSYIKNVIETIGGEIKLIASTKEEGTTFDILLPVASLTD